jgi:hypothetical protein
VEPCGRRGLLDVAVAHVAVTTGLAREDPDDTTVVEDRLDVHQRVGEVAVVLAPPDDDAVRDVVVVLVDELRPGDRLDGSAQGVVDVLGPAELLDDEP